ncbi:MAG: amino acid racemase [Candidatus Aminicenantes bacterium]|nr:amino acid racemase [Candidatus Aminicenantes bacterium]
MNKKKTKTIGILGGMGPEATARFFELIIKNTVAKQDQEHLKIIVYNNPQTPDRTKAILYGGENPLPSLINGLKILEKAGAEICAMPCMTAHYFFPSLEKKTRLQLVHLIRETANYLKKTYPQVKKVGLLATTGTIATKIFHLPLEKKGLQVLTPLETEGQMVMEAIYGPKGIKAGFSRGRTKRLLRQVAQKLISRGAEAIIAGCTEVPLALGEEDLSVPLVDPMVIGARVLIKKSGGALKHPDFLTNSQ